VLRKFNDRKIVFPRKSAGIIEYPYVKSQMTVTKNKNQTNKTPRPPSSLCTI
jgi:hypothetical protein